MMVDQLAYLGRSLSERANDAAQKADTALNVMMRQHAVQGRLASGNTLHAFRTESLRIFHEEFGSAAQFAFNLMGKNDEKVVEAISNFGGRVVDLIYEKIVLCGQRTGIAEATVAREINSIRVALQERRARALDDFSHGMIGDERLKRDPVVSVINSQTNSPGAIQQVGVGEFSQTAFLRQHHPLIAAIDAVLASPEFEKLQPEQKQGFRDIADVVKEEASKTAPDPGKLKRWSDHLIRMGSEVGMRVAVSDIAQLIAKIFVG